MSSRIRARPAASVPCPPLEQAESIVASFLTDAAHVGGGFTGGVAFPTSEAEVAALVTAHSRVLPIGAQSSLTGGATPRGDIVLSTRRLTTIDTMDAHRVRAGAGVPLLTLQQHLAAEGLYYPPVPTFDGAFVGGTVSTNAAGPATFKYGPTRPWIQELTVVLANGTVLDLTRGRTTASREGRFEVEMPDGTCASIPVPRYVMPALPKLSAGYFAAPAMDLIDLFIGSEGTLGVMTSAVLRVIARPTRAAVLVTCEDEAQALRVTAALREQARLAWVGRGPLDVSAIEYIDARALAVVPDAVFTRTSIERPPAGAVMLLVQMEIVTGQGDAFAALGDVLVEASVVRDPLIAPAGDDRGARRLFDLREAVPAAVNAIVAEARQRVDAAIEKTAGDFIVPFDRLEHALGLVRDACRHRRIDVAIWGHVSDGNVHINVVPGRLEDVIAGREVLVALARDVIRLGGSPLAEHGVGRSRMKQQLLRELYGDDGIAQMRAVKRALDPGWKLSPGVVFD